MASLEVQKVLVISSMHMSKADSIVAEAIVLAYLTGPHKGALMESPLEGMLFGSLVFKAVQPKYAEGWSGPLRRALAFGWHHGFDLVRFDRDAPTINELPIGEWDGEGI